MEIVLSKNKKKSNIISYIGSKVNLMEFLEEKIFQKYQKKPYTFYDLFAGTNSVSKYIINSKNKKNWNVITNDIHNYSYRLSYFMNFINIEKEKRIDIINLLNELNELPLIDTGIFFNEFSVNGNITTANDLEKMFSNQKVKTRLFFPEIVGKKIDTIRKEIFKWKKDGKINTIEENILFIFLLSYADKNANTTSVYGAYLKDDNKAVEKKLFYNEDLINEFLDMKISKKTRNITHYNKNISDILNILNEKNTGSNASNIVYLDPPYSTRSYEANYHVLEYISKEDFSISDINYNSKTAQPSNQIENPFRKKGETLKIFKEMIRKSLRFSDNVYISYSTDGLIKEEQIIEYLEELKKEFPTVIFNKDLKPYKKYKSSHKDIKNLVIELNSLLHKSNKNIEDINKISQLETLIEESKKQLDNNEDTELYEILWHFSIPPKDRNKKGKIDKIFEVNKDKILEFKNNGFNLKKQVEILSKELNIKIPYPTYAYHYKKHFGNIVKKQEKYIKDENIILGTKTIIEDKNNQKFHIKGICKKEDITRDYLNSLNKEELIGLTLLGLSTDKLKLIAKEKNKLLFQTGSVVKKKHFL